MSNTQRDGRFSRAEQALEEYFAVRTAGDKSALSFQDFVALHPEIAGELRELHALCGEVDHALEHGQETFVAQQAEIQRMLTSVGATADFERRYAVEGEVGKGGMGAVYRVVDRKLDRPLAMKVILGQVETVRSGKTPPLAPRQLARFLNEAKITSQLDHPGIVPVHEVGVDHAGRAYFTMKLVKGRTLGEVFQARAASDPEWSTARVLGVLQRVCEALAFAHDRGVIHRDLKPANVMVGDFGEVYVMDWGLARRLGEREENGPTVAAVEEELSAQLTLTREGQILGTPTYMSPEQASGELERVGPHSDVYALGAMLYQLLAGHPPYCRREEHPSGAAVIARILQGPPQKLVARDIPPELIAICEKAMARDPSARYATMDVLAGELRAFLERRVVRAYRTGAVEELVKWTRRNRGTAAAVAATLVVLLGGASTLVVVERANAESERELARSVAAEKATALEALQAEQAALVVAEKETAKARTELETRQRTIALMERLFRAPSPENAQGREVTAREILDHAREELEGGEVTEPQVLGTLQIALGSTYSSLGDYEHSLELLTAGASHLEAALGPSHRDVLRAKRGLAESLQRKDRLAEAIAVSREILEASLAAFGPDHFETIHSSSRLGVILLSAGRFEEGDTLVEEAYLLSVEQYGAKDSRTLGFGKNLLSVLDRQGRLDEALELARAILADERSNEGELSPEYLYSMDNLGSVFAGVGRLAEAEELFRASFEGMMRVLGPDHEHTYYASFNLGNAYLDAGRFEEAREELELTLANRERLLGPGHDRTLRTRDSLSAAQFQCGDLEEAARLSSLNYALARDAATSASTRLNILTRNAAHHEERGTFEAAVRLYEELLAQQELEGVPHGETAETLEGLVRVHVRLQDLDAAGRRFEQLLALEAPEHAACVDALALELDTARAGLHSPAPPPHSALPVEGE